MEELTCFLCHKGGLQSLSNHIAKKHHISIDEYRNLTGYNGPMYTSESKERRIASLKKANTLEVREKKSKTVTKRWQEEEVRQKMLNKLEENKEQRINNIQKGWKEYQEKKPISPDKILRNELFNRANSRCEICGISEKELLDNNKKRLHLHHKTYGKIVPELDDVLLLCPSCHATLHKTDKTDRNDRVCRAIGELLRVLGVDIMGSDFRETPRRMATYFMENVLSDDEIQYNLEEYASSVFENIYDGMILLKDTDIISMCPHHLLPVFYKVSIGYIPVSGLAIGLSKLHRIADIIAKKPMMQETYTSKLADYFQTLLDTKDVAIRVIGNHSCMSVRGVRVPGSEVLTTELRGAFMSDSSTRQEFYLLLNS